MRFLASYPSRKLERGSYRKPGGRIPSELPNPGNGGAFCCGAEAIGRPTRQAMVPSPYGKTLVHHKGSSNSVRGQSAYGRTSGPLRQAAGGYHGPARYPRGSEGCRGDGSRACARWTRGPSGVAVDVRSEVFARPNAPDSAQSVRQFARVTPRDGCRSGRVPPRPLPGTVHA